MNQEQNDEKGTNLKINTKDIDIECIKLQKMIFLFNAVEDGWKIKKQDNYYVFSKNHENKKEIFLDTYLKAFMKENFNINNIGK